jgi:hypothetical protein
MFYVPIMFCFYHIVHIEDIIIFLCFKTLCNNILNCLKSNVLFLLFYGTLVTLMLLIFTVSNSYFATICLICVIGVPFFL